MLVGQKRYYSEISLYQIPTVYSE